MNTLPLGSAWDISLDELNALRAAGVEPIVSDTNEPQV
jgi:hypothetical protein